MDAPLNSELFLLPDGAEYLVYAPLRKVVARATAENVNLLVRLQRGQADRAEAETEFCKAVTKAGLIGGQPEVRPPASTNRPYAPVRVTLLLTTRCNLACQYCYAGHAAHGLVMSEQVGRAAIDYAAANCKRLGQPHLHVAYHGGGEPTMAWEELVALTTYAEEVAARNQLKLNLGLATNGCVSERKAHWIAAHFPSVNLSLDGPPRIQNAQRPLQGGGASWPLLRRTLRILDQSKVGCYVQATVTRETVQDMPAIVRFVARHTRARQVKFEPVADCGRFAGQPDRVPSATDFARYLLAAYLEGNKLKIPVAFSGLRFDGTPRSLFCGAFGEPFSVTPEGYVTACFEAFCGASRLANLYVFGRWDAAGGFIIEHDKLERLRQRNVYNLAPCLHCFCKYSCAGDCASRNARFFDERDLLRVGARCQTVREVGYRFLSHFARQTPKTNSQPEKEPDAYEPARCA